jgi:type I restriction enzyme S subunit
MKRKGILTTENTENAEVDAVASVRSVVNTEDLPDNFQMTELGPLPKEWRVVRLGEILMETNQRVREIEGQDIVVLSITRHFGLISQEEKFKKRVASQNLDNYKVVHRGELVYGFPMDEGVIHFLWQYPMGAVSPVYYTWKLYNSQADAHFLDYLLKTPHLLRIYEMLQSKTVHRRRIVHPKDFINISIPLPPLPEQRAIAHVLRTVQRAKEATEGVIAALKELKKSLMQHLFTYGPVPVTERERVPLQETEIGPIPAHWRVVRLGDLVEREILLMRNGFPQGQHNEIGVGVPHLRPFNITNDGILDLSQIKFVAPPSDDDPRWLHPGDVIFNNTNSEELVGKTALFNRNGRFVLSNHMTFLRVLEPGQIDPYWLARLLHLFWYLGMYRALSRRHVNQVSISLERLKGVRIPLPPLDEQREIARMLQAVDAKIAAEQTRRAALEDLFKTLLHELMSGRRRVSLATQSLGE